MKITKLKILTLALAVVLSQGTCVYAASSSSGDYSKEELENLTPGFEWKDKDKSNYKVNSYTNSFSGSQTSDQEDDEKDTSTKTSKTSTNTIDSNLGNVIVSTAPSTGVQGDFWGKTADGKWILLEQGIPVNGWRYVRGNWYYMDAEGVMQTGWVNYNDTWYYLKPSGEMAYNTVVDGYYLDWSGAAQ